MKSVQYLGVHKVCLACSWVFWCVKVCEQSSPLFCEFHLTFPAVGNLKALWDHCLFVKWCSVCLDCWIVLLWQWDGAKGKVRQAGCVAWFPWKMKLKKTQRAPFTLSLKQMASISKPLQCLIWQSSMVLYYWLIKAKSFVSLSSQLVFLGRLEANFMHTAGKQRSLGAGRIAGFLLVPCVLWHRTVPFCPKAWEGWHQWAGEKKRPNH